MASEVNHIVNQERPVGWVGYHGDIVHLTDDCCSSETPSSEHAEAATYSYVPSCVMMKRTMKASVAISDSDTILANRDF